MLLMSILRTTQLAYVVFFVFIIQIMFYREHKLYIMSEIIQLCNIVRFYATYVKFGLCAIRRTRV